MENNKDFLEKFFDNNGNMYFVNKRYINHVFEYDDYTSLTDEYFSIILGEYLGNKMTIRNYIEGGFGSDKYTGKEAVEMYFDIKTE